MRIRIPGDQLNSDLCGSGSESLLAGLHYNSFKTSCDYPLTRHAAKQKSWMCLVKWRDGWKWHLLKKLYSTYRKCNCSINGTASGFLPFYHKWLEAFQGQIFHNSSLLIYYWYPVPVHDDSILLRCKDWDIRPNQCCGSGRFLFGSDFKSARSGSSLYEVFPPRNVLTKSYI
jgi:hypothetical protein